MRRKSHRKRDNKIFIKNSSEIEKMREAGSLAREVLNHVGKFIEPGISTLKLNDIAEKFTRDHGAISAPLNYKGFPKSICSSIDSVVCHGIPSKKDILKNGQIINIDITVILNGFHGDVNKTYKVGDVSPEKSRLVFIAEKAMYRGIETVKPGNTLGDVGYAIQKYVERNGYSVVRDFIGHGIGRAFHEEPAVHHVGKKGKGIKLIPGMTFTIEPMINLGDYKVKVLADNWTVLTVDGGPSAQFENTVLVTETGYEILTPDI